MSSREVAPGVFRIESAWWGHYYDGPKAAMIAACLAKAEWFADGQERNRRGLVVRTKRLCVDGRKIITRTFPGTERVRVEHPLTKEERCAKEEQERAAYGRQQQC